MESLKCLARPPWRAHPPTPTHVPVSPGAEIGSRGDLAVPENLPQLESRASQDIAFPVPGSMSLGNIETWEAKRNEVNEVAIEDRRMNPVEKLVTL